MSLSINKLIGLSVVTVSGQDLGVVRSVEFDQRTHEVSKYVVAPSSLVKKLLSGDLLIAPEQVVSLTEEQMVVEDTVTKIPKLEIAPTV